MCQDFKVPTLERTVIFPTSCNINILLRVVLAGTTTDDISRLDGMLGMTA
jgi:hypothetical protein